MADDFSTLEKCKEKIRILELKVDAQRTEVDTMMVALKLIIN